MRNLKYMHKFAEEYLDVEFVQQVACRIALVSYCGDYG
nr:MULTISPECIES: hypothetical protein [unclassified Wolbachia]